MKSSDILNTPETLASVVASADKTDEMTSKQLTTLCMEQVLSIPSICEWAQIRKSIAPIRGKTFYPTTLISRGISDKTSALVSVMTTLSSIRTPLRFGR